MRAKVRRWGNGLALRVRKKDLESAGVSEGDVVEVKVSRPSSSGAIDLETMPAFRDADRFASVRHDRYLYG
jgi:antitoxin component of MazEF toxin-antitoxin module